jgi:hypothetical protein
MMIAKNLVTLYCFAQLFNKLTPEAEASWLNKSSWLAPFLGVNEVITVRNMILVTLFSCLSQT